MATVIDTVINTDKSELSLKQLNKLLKDLISLQGQVAAGSDQFKKLQKAINETEGKIGDLKDSFQTLRGSGVERLTGSIGLLREGFLNADPEKLSIGLQGLKAAMSAIPIFLLIEGLKLLIENFQSIVNFVKEVTDSFSEEEKALRTLTAQYEKQHAANVQNQADLTNEISLLKAKDAPLQNILKAQQQLYDLKIADLQLEKLREQARLAEQKSTVSLTASLISFFGAFTANNALILKANEDKIKSVSETAAKIAEITRSINATETEKEVNKIETLNEIRDREEKTRRAVSELRIQDIANDEERELALLKEKNKQEQYDNRLNYQILKAINIAYNNDLDEIQKKYGAMRAAIAAEDRNREQKYQEASAQAELELERQKNQEEIDFYLATTKAEEDIDRQVEERTKARRGVRNKNALAFESSFQQESVQQKIDFIEQERDILLQNEDITQKQRIAIIEKAENDILQLKVKKAQEYLGYVQKGNEILNGLAAIRVQDENYNLQQEQYAKDAAVENDNNRTQEKLDAEKAYSAQLLQSENLTSEQRQAITQNSEAKQKQITEESKNVQLALNESFAKEETEIRRKQFERNKALQIGTGIINTAAAVLQTLSSVPFPASVPLGILAAAAGAVQVGLIAKQKFDDGGAGAKASVRPVSSGGSSGGGFGSVSPTPSFNSNATTPINGINNTGSVPIPEKPVKVYVLESDIRNVTGKVDVIQTRAAFVD